MNDLGRRMRLAIQASRMIQRDVAAKTGVHESGLSRYVNGKQIPMADYLTAFVNVTGCDGHWLLTGQGEVRYTSRGEAAKILKEARRVLG